MTHTTNWPTRAVLTSLHDESMARCNPGPDHDLLALGDTTQAGDEVWKNGEGPWVPVRAGIRIGYLTAAVRRRRS